MGCNKVNLEQMTDGSVLNINGKVYHVDNPQIMASSYEAFPSSDVKFIEQRKKYTHIIRRDGDKIIDISEEHNL